MALAVFLFFLFSHKVSCQVELMQAVIFLHTFAQWAWLEMSADIV